MIETFNEGPPNPNLVRLAEALTARDLFFFAGSGISYDSSLPSAEQILRNTVVAVLPSLRESEITNICKRIQPEIFYEILINTAGTRESLHLWSSLHNDTQRRFAVRCQPNLAHFFIVESAAQSGYRLLTTNFDFMFEAAASALGLQYKVYLPDMDPPKLGQSQPPFLAICKLHGSIQDSTGRFTPDSLWTTMTEISKVNTRWIEYIHQRMRSGHLCFVGYSARDIDLFPYIKAFALQPSSKAVFWINKFDGDNSDQASVQCNAVRVENMWPREAFEVAAKQLHIPGGSTSLEVSPPFQDDGNSKLHDMLRFLTDELTAKLSLKPAVKQLIFGFLLGRLANFGRALDMLSKLEASAPQDLMSEQRGELLLACARLSHEVSRYTSCRRYAKRALDHAKSMVVGGMDIQIQARCLLSESLRMSIPHETYFAGKRDVRLYGLLVFTFLHFLFTAMMNRYSMFLAGKKLSDLHIAAQHEILEHSIRLGAMTQRVLGSPQKGWSRFWRGLLQRYWEQLHKTSYELGYAAGIANTRRFLYRLNPTKETKSESDNIYNLMTYSTGKELSTRNFADVAVSERRFDEAKSLYYEFVALAEQSGNRLNAIKGLLGIMYINSLSGVKPLLDQKDTELFDKLTNGFEGRLWTRHFGDLRSMLDS